MYTTACCGCAGRLCEIASCKHPPLDGALGPQQTCSGSSLNNNQNYLEVLSRPSCHKASPESCPIHSRRVVGRRITVVGGTVLVVIHGPPDFYSCSYGIGPAGVRRSARAQEGKLTDWATPPHPEGGRTVEHHLAADSGTHWATGQVREKRWCAMLRGLRRPKIFCVRQSWTGESAHTQ